MSNLFDLFQIVLVDLSLAGDNALVIGMAVSVLPEASRKRALVLGIAVATLLRVFLAFFAAQLLHITGLLVAGGILLLWVGWKMAHGIRTHKNTPKDLEQATTVSFRSVIWQIVFADLSMSLDNVLGVAGVARDHAALLVMGLVLSVLLMGIASTYIARLVERYPRISYMGVAIVLYVALTMIYDGMIQTLGITPPLA